jgi:pimeloyl-ACP methyl ester carboxylesterase
MNSKTISYQNSSLHYKLTGSGEPLMLLHGFAEDSRIWDTLIEPLSAEHTLIIPDIPGSGQSARLTGNDIQLTDYADCMQAILEEESIKECIIIGHSMGGYITLAFAEMYPEKLKAIGLFHSSAYADDDAKKETRLKAIDFIRVNGAEAFLKTSIPGLFADATKSKRAIDTLIQRGKEFSSEALIQYYEAMINRPDRTHVLEKYPDAVLIIAGLHDKAVPFEHSLQQSYLPAITDFNVLRNSAHMGMLEEKEKSFSVLSHFLQFIYV